MPTPTEVYDMQRLIDTYIEAASMARRWVTAVNAKKLDTIDIIINSVRFVIKVDVLTNYFGQQMADAHAKCVSAGINMEGHSNGTT